MFLFVASYDCPMSCLGSCTVICTVLCPRLSYSEYDQYPSGRRLDMGIAGAGNTALLQGHLLLVFSVGLTTRRCSWFNWLCFA